MGLFDNFGNIGKDIFQSDAARMWGKIDPGVGYITAKFDKEDANETQQRAMEDAQKRLEDLQRKSWYERQWAANRAMSLFAPTVGRANMLTGFQVNDPGPGQFFTGGMQTPAAPQSPQAPTTPQGLGPLQGGGGWRGR